MMDRNLSGPDLAGMIDHTLVRPDATTAEIERLCREAREYGFASVCVNSCHVRLCARLLTGSAVKVGTTVGFPLGAMSTAAKVQETTLAIDDGAQEVEMVLNIGMLKSGNPDAVEEDIRDVVQAAHARGRLVKVILETGLLTDEEKVAACGIAKRAGADFVKTSTGFGRGGATVADVALMRKTVGTSLGVKASGGIRTREDALTMIRAGANRLGASAGIQIVGQKP